MTKLNVPQEVQDFAQTLHDAQMKVAFGEVNDNFTQIRLRTALANECEKHMHAYTYEVRCDATNNPASVVDDRDLVADVTLVDANRFAYVLTLNMRGVIIQGWQL